MQLPAEQKESGARMSRCVAWLDARDAPLDTATPRQQLAAMFDTPHADDGRIEARFPFFLRKRAPVLVEDLARDVALRPNADPRIASLHRRRRELRVDPPPLRPRPDPTVTHAAPRHP